MSTTVTFELKKTYSFDTKVPNILGTNYKNMKVIGGPMSPELVVSTTNVYDIHEQVRGANQTLAGLDVNNLHYMVFKTTDDTTVVFPIEYLENINQVNNIDIILTIYGAASTDQAVLMDRLRELGYNNIDIEITTSNTSNTP